MYIYPLKIKNIVLYCIVLYCIDLRHLRARQTYRRLISDSRGFNNGKLSGELNELYTPDILVSERVHLLFMNVDAQHCG